MSSNETAIGSDESLISSNVSTTSANECAKSSEESATSKTKRPTPAEQDEALANFISQSRVTLDTLLATPELLGRL